MRRFTFAQQTKTKRAQRVGLQAGRLSAKQTFVERLVSSFRSHNLEWNSAVAAESPNNLGSAFEAQSTRYSIRFTGKGRLAHADCENAQEKRLNDKFNNFFSLFVIGNLQFISREGDDNAITYIRWGFV